MKIPRMSSQTLVVLACFAAKPGAWRYGYELSVETDLKAGTLYPILVRLTEHAVLEAKWVTTEKGTPPRHMYRLTAAGKQFAKERVAEARESGWLPRPAITRA